MIKLHHVANWKSGMRLSLSVRADRGLWSYGSCGRLGCLIVLIIQQITSNLISNIYIQNIHTVYTIYSQRSNFPHWARRWWCDQ